MPPTDVAAAEIVARQSGFARVLGAAMAARDLPLDRLASRLHAAGTPVSVATLSYWRTGRSVPTRGNSVRAVEALEEILGVAPGDLTGALPGDVHTRWNPLPVLPSPDLVRRVVEGDLGLNLNRRLTTLHHHESLTVGRDGVQESSDVAQLVRCEVDDVAAQFVVIQQDSASHDTPRLEGLAGCEVGRTYCFDKPRLSVVEILLPRPFSRGELLSMSYRIHWAPAEVTDDWTGRAFPSPVLYLTQEIRFTGRVPRRVVARQQTTLRSQPGTERDLPTDAFVQHVQADAEPGLHTLRWTW